MDPLTDPARVLVVTAHPDDVDFGAGGTVAALVARGSAVSYCIVTDGDAGGFDPAVPRWQIPGIRRAEQQAAAAELGVSDVRFLGYRDGQLTVTHELRRDISRVIREVRPHLVITQSPERNYQRMYASHPDHMAAGEAALQAHVSQVAHMTDLRERITTWGAANATEGGLPAGRLAEAFTVIDTRG